MPIMPPRDDVEPYKRWIARIIPRRLHRSMDLHQGRVLHREWGETDNTLYTNLDKAEENGSIGEHECDDLLDADIIAVGKDADANDAYAVVEIGVTVNSSHVNRAARRARTLANATGSVCSAIVVAGSEIPDAERERASRAGVSVIVVTAPED